MSDIQLPSLESWADVYEMLRAKAETFRGTITLTPNGAPSTTVPHTTSRDVFALSLVFDTAVDENVSGSLGERWITESDLLAGEPEDSVDPYVGNRSFWTTLAEIATELDRVHAPLPSLSPINEAISELETTRPRASSTRNAVPATFVTVFTERSWTSMAFRQLEFFHVLRGYVPTNLFFLSTVPATRNADVVALAAYWTDQVARVGNSASDTAHRLAYANWREAVQRAAQLAKQAAPHDTYPDNVEFWTALLLLATQSDACREPPTPWAFHAPQPSGHHGYRNAETSAAKPADTGAAKPADTGAAKPADTGAAKPTDLPTALKNAAENFVGNVLARPLLYAGLGLGGIAMTVLLFRSGRR